MSCLQRLSTPSETWTARTATTKSAPGIETQRTRSAHHTIIPTGKDVRAVDDLLPQAQSCPLMLMLHASNQQSLCSCFASIRNGMLRSGEMTTSCPRSCTNKKRASTSAVETADNGGGQRGRRDAGFAPDDKLDTRELINVSGARRVPLHPSTA